MANKYIYKTDGNGNKIKVIDPDYFLFYETGVRVKKRKISNYTRPKKRRK